MKNVTGAYLVYNYAYLQALVNKALTWQSSCIVANYIQKYSHMNFGVKNVMKCM